MFDLLANVISTPPLVPIAINIDPKTNGVPGIILLRTIVGAMMTVGVILSVFELIVCGFAANSITPLLASRGKFGVLVSRGAAVVRRVGHAHQRLPERRPSGLSGPSSRVGVSSWACATFL